MFDHPSPEVRAAAIALADALCQFERATGSSSVLILHTQHSAAFRCLDGKPVPPSVPDEQLLSLAR
jgi:hypothetical protein